MKHLKKVRIKYHLGLVNMGSFDSFLIKNFKCPQGHIFKIAEFQTKGLDRSFNNFYLGKKINWQGKYSISEGKLKGCLYCYNCEEKKIMLLYQYWIIIKDNKFIKVVRNKKEDSKYVDLNG